MIRLFLALLALLGTDGPPAAAPVTRVKLRPQVTVLSGELSLSDLAEIDGPRSADVRKLRIGYAPAVGAERKLLASVVEAKLSALGKREEFVLEGAGTVISTEAHRIEGAELASRVESALRARAAEGARIEILAQPAEFAVAMPRAGAAAIELDVRLPERDLRGALTVDVLAKCGHELLGTSSVQVRVTLEAEVLVASAPIGKGDPIDPSKLTLKKVDITQLKSQPLRHSDALIGRVAARAIASGEVLASDDFALAPVFRKGERTTLVIVRGSLRIEAAVRVDADAVVGARVPITCLETEKTLLARVSPQGTLQLIAQDK
ncbi:MAG: flagellar basal body P-ring formation protein FlgA [Planctomycetes bacterium]|nr:flagellar basal body P-ring formation protein FlgA [Planctomycetota bacterium]